jgi:acyl-homoserine lactone acylase PvdQ
MNRGLVALLVAVLLAAVVPAGAADDGRYRDFGDPGGFLNILPPGQRGVVNGPDQIQSQMTGELPEHVADQLVMYDGILDATPGISEEQLTDYYKDASFGVPPDDIGRVYSPTDDVVVIRDASFDVPHIFGETREATMFASGYTTAEDRLFLMDILRHLGRGRLSEFLGASESNQQMDREQLAVAPYREEDLTAQTVPREDFGAAAAQIRADGEAYLAGVNAYVAEAVADFRKRPAEYEALQQLPDEFVLEDFVAIASLVGGIFGGGGGRELANFCGTQGIAETLGAAQAQAVFDDLKLNADPETPTTTARRFDFPDDLGPVDPAAIPDIDCGTLEPIDGGTPSLDDIIEAISGAVPGPLGRTGVVDGPFGPIPLRLSNGASNAVLVSAEHTATGSPLAVFGPQTAYFSPQLLVEKDVHGPGISARGVGFAGVDLYVQMGRGTDYAWSATSSKADAVDTFVLQLCEPSGGEATTASMGHLHDGTCVEIDGWNHTQIAKPSAAAPPESGEVVLSWRMERSPVYGPLIARGETTDGTPIAVATSRTTYGEETVNALGFYRVNDPEYMADGYPSFRRAMGEGIQYSFNWFYVDADDIGYQSACSCPVKARGVDPDLPVWGTGEWDWRGSVAFDQLPWDVNPPTGFIADWNNRNAPGWRPPDAEFSFGSVHRKQLLDRRVAPLIAAGDVTRERVVDVVIEAGTTDLRAQELMPVLHRLLGDDVPDDADGRVERMWRLLRDWAADDGGHRRDRDRDGSYEHAQAVAVMDAWWPQLVAAILDEESGGAVAHLGLEVHDPPQLGLGSAFHYGMYGQVHKDLRQVLGEPVTGPFSRTYCGAGDLSTCRTAVWASLDAAAADLDAEFDSSDVDDWQRDWTDDAIVHTPAGITSLPLIHWQNRSTFHQVVQIPVGKP